MTTCYGNVCFNPLHGISYFINEATLLLLFHIFSRDLFWRQSYAYDTLININNKNTIQSNLIIHELLQIHPIF